MYTKIRSFSTVSDPILRARIEACRRNVKAWLDDWRRTVDFFDKHPHRQFATLRGEARHYVNASPPLHQEAALMRAWEAGGVQVYAKRVLSGRAIFRFLRPRHPSEIWGEDKDEYFAAGAFRANQLDWQEAGDGAPVTFDRLEIRGAWRHVTNGWLQ